MEWLNSPPAWFIFIWHNWGVRRTSEPFVNWRFCPDLFRRKCNIQNETSVKAVSCAAPLEARLLRAGTGTHPSSWSKFCLHMAAPPFIRCLIQNTGEFQGLGCCWRKAIVQSYICIICITFFLGCIATGETGRAVGGEEKVRRIGTWTPNFHHLALPQDLEKDSTLWAWISFFAQWKL